MVWLRLFSEDLGWEAGVGWRETEKMRERKEVGENQLLITACSVFVFEAWVRGQVFGYSNVHKISRTNIGY